MEMKKGSAGCGPPEVFLIKLVAKQDVYFTTIFTFLKTPDWLYTLIQQEPLPTAVTFPEELTLATFVFVLSYLIRLYLISFLPVTISTALI